MPSSIKNWTVDYDKRCTFLFNNDTLLKKMAETKEHIDLPDCEYEGMLELLRFIYTDEVCLNPPGGGVLRKVLYGEAPPQVLTPYPFIYHFCH